MPGRSKAALRRRRLPARRYAFSFTTAAAHREAQAAVPVVRGAAAAPAPAPAPREQPRPRSAGLLGQIAAHAAAQRRGARRQALVVRVPDGEAAELPGAALRAEIAGLCPELCASDAAVLRIPVGELARKARGSVRSTGEELERRSHLRFTAAVADHVSHWLALQGGDANRALLKMPFYARLGRYLRAATALKKCVVVVLAGAQHWWHWGRRPLNAESLAELTAPGSALERLCVVLAVDEGTEAEVDALDPRESGLQYSRKVCTAADVPDGGAVALTAAECGRDSEGLVLWRRGDELRVYANRCPHARTPLNWGEEGALMSADGKHLVCATHDARFRPEDGFCICGPCDGDTLSVVPFRVVDGAVMTRAACVGDWLAALSGGTRLTCPTHSA